MRSSIVFIIALATCIYLSNTITLNHQRRQCQKKVYDCQMNTCKSIIDKMNALSMKSQHHDSQQASRLSDIFKVQNEMAELGQKMQKCANDCMNKHNCHPQ